MLDVASQVRTRHTLPRETYKRSYRRVCVCVGVVPAEWTQHPYFIEATAAWGRRRKIYSAKKNCHLFIFCTLCFKILDRQWRGNNEASSHIPKHYTGCNFGISQCILMSGSARSVNDAHRDVRKMRMSWQTWGREAWKVGANRLTRGLYTHFPMQTQPKNVISVEAAFSVHNSLSPKWQRFVTASIGS